MQQKHPHFLFPQTYFGSLPDFDEEADEMDLNAPWVLIMDPIEMDAPQDVGLFIRWMD